MTPFSFGKGGSANTHVGSAEKKLIMRICEGEIMKIFISWSGDLSHKVALVFKEWLPSVIQSVEAYVSSEDIDKGARWSSDISKALEESFFGVLCITKDNIDAPWINFEAGALSKSFEKSKISPFLFGLNRTELQGPLLQFQSTINDKEDIKKLVSSINKSCAEVCLEDARFDKVFDVWWPELHEKLSNLKKENVADRLDVKDKKSLKENIIEEILLLARNQQQLLANPTNLLPPDYLYSIFKDIMKDRRSLDVQDDLYFDIVRRFHAVRAKFRAFLGSSDDDRTDELAELDASISRLADPILYLENQIKPLRRRPRVAGAIIKDDN